MTFSGTDLLISNLQRDARDCRVILFRFGGKCLLVCPNINANRLLLPIFFNLGLTFNGQVSTADL